MPEGKPNQGGTQVSSGDTTFLETGAPTSTSPTSTPGDASIETSAPVNLLASLISPSSVVEERPGRSGNQVSAYFGRELRRLRKRVGDLEAVQ